MSSPDSPMFQRIWQKLCQLWQRVKQLFLKSPPPQTPPPPDPEPSFSECEQIFLPFLQSVKLDGIRVQLKVFLIKNQNIDWDKWLQEFGDRVLASPELNLELGERLLLLSEANYEKISKIAGKIGRELLARKPKNEGEDPKDLYNQGVARYYAGDLKGAIEAFDRAIALDPNFTASHHGRGNVLSELGRYNEAIEAFDRAIALDPNIAPPHHGRGTVLSKLGRYNEAIEAYDRAIALDPNIAPFHHGRGTVLSELGRYNEAIEAYDRAIALDPNIARPHTARGNVLANLGRYNEAIEAFDRAIALDPNIAPPHRARGNVLSELGRYNEAIEAYDRAIALDPNIARPHTARGNVLANLGRYNEAIEAFDRAIALDPNDAASHHGRGNVLSELGRYNEAIEAYDRAIALDPNDAASHHGRGNVLANLGRYNEAIEAYDRAIALDPNITASHHGRGNVLSELGRYNEAIEAYDRAIALDPNYAAPHGGRGIVLYHLGRYKEAIAAYDRALYIAKDQDWQSWNNRGLAFFDSDRYEEAIKNWDEGLKKYQESNPDYRLACGTLHQQKGEAHYKYGKRTNFQSVYFCKAKASYEQACEFLKSALIAKNYIITETYLEVLQALIIVCRALGDSQADEYLDQGTNLLENLRLDHDTPAEIKLRFNRKFSAFSQFKIEQLVQSGQQILALETAERRKNQSLKWMETGWQNPDQIDSPTFAQIQGLLTNQPQTAIIYWHLSPFSLTTFIIRHSGDPQVITTDIYPFTLDRKEHLSSLEEWLKTWKSEYQNSRKNKHKDAQNPSLKDWQKHLETSLNNLKEILNIETICQQYLTGITHLILSPHRDFHLLPLHYLFWEQNFTITYLPTIKMSRRFPRENSTPTNLLMVKDPSGTMVYSATESDLIINKYPQTHQLLNQQSADKNRVIVALQQGRDIFHFTGHGIHNFDNPEDSGLQLTQKELLTLTDIFELDFHRYNLICLSACETGLTSSQDLINEYVGLGSGFLAKGAKYVVSTLWEVEDIATANLMIKFYENLPDHAPPVALKQAQNWLRTVTKSNLIEWYEQLMTTIPEGSKCWRALQSSCNQIRQRPDIMEIKTYADPYYWAGFTITGYEASNEE